MLPWGLIIIFVIGGYIWGVQYKHDNIGTNVIYPEYTSFQTNTPPPTSRQQMGALGGYLVKTDVVRYGQVIPINRPQGLESTNQLGREGMLPHNYMIPDNFNHPPQIYLNQPSVDL